MASSHKHQPLTANQQKEKRDAEALGQQILSKKNLPPEVAIQILDDLKKVEIARKKAADKKVLDIAKKPAQILSDPHHSTQDNETTLLNQVKHYLKRLKDEADIYLKHEMLTDKYETDYLKGVEYKKKKAAAFQGLKQFLQLFKHEQLNCLSVTAEMISYLITHINQAHTQRSPN